MSVSLVETICLSGDIVLASLLKTSSGFMGNSYGKNDYIKTEVNVSVFLLVEITQLRPRKMKKKCSYGKFSLFGW